MTAFPFSDGIPEDSGYNVTKPTDQDVIEEQCHNPFKTIFSQEVWGGMSMATIAIHEDYPKEPVHDPDDRLPSAYKNIPIEICVAGKCITTTLDKIIAHRTELAEAVKECNRVWLEEPMTVEHYRKITEEAVEAERGRVNNQWMEVMNSQRVGDLCTQYTRVKNYFKENPSPQSDNK